MRGKQSKHTGHSDDNEQTSSASAGQSSNTSQSTGDITKKDALSKLPDNVLRHISEYLTPEEEARLRMSKPALKRSERDKLRGNGVTPPLITFFALPQRTADYLVLTGRPESLIKILQKDPTIFFRKYEKSTDAAGQTFYNVSPADLISFICDDDMQMQVNHFAQQLPVEQREKFFTQWQVHHASRGRGGADLVLVTGAHPPQYASICNVTHTFNVLGETNTIERALLKNPDGMICWRDPDNRLHWYYANHDTQTLEPIDIPLELQAAHQADYEAFVARMLNMEPNTARRSSNQEHALIQALMRHQDSQEPVRLAREGIHYRQDGIDYIDTHYDFNRIVNAYLKYIRLHNNRNHREDNRVWRAELGHVQREVMWLVQRYCEINRLFLPLADNYKETPFVRASLEIFNYNTRNMERLFDAKTGKFAPGFGRDNIHSGFAIYVGCRVVLPGAGRGVAAAMRGDVGGGDGSVADLVAVNRLCVDATQNVESRLEISVSNSPGATR